MVWVSVVVSVCVCIRCGWLLVLCSSKLFISCCELVSSLLMSCSC